MPVKQIGIAIGQATVAAAEALATLNGLTILLETNLLKQYSAGKPPCQN